MINSKKTDKPTIRKWQYHLCSKFTEIFFLCLLYFLFEISFGEEREAVI